jgi:hypothetical protein
MAHFGVYFTDGNNKTIELPVAPSEFGLVNEMDATTEILSSVGEVNLRGKRLLYEIEFDFMIPVKVKEANYTTAQKLYANGDDYIKFIRGWSTSNKPVGRIVVTGASSTYSVPCTVDKFDYRMADGDDSRYQCSITLKEWRDSKAKKIQVAKASNGGSESAKKGATKSTPAKAVTVGCTVVVNGQLHRDSYGNGPGQTERNVTRKVNFINKGAKCPYHVTTLEGGWRGWVEAKAVTVK